LDEKKTNCSKKPRRLDEMAYAEMLRDEESEWTRVEGRRKVRSRIESSTGREGLNGRTQVRVARERTPRRWREAILVKVGQGTNWIDSYREAEVKSALKETTAVRKTKAGHILIELTSKVTVDEVADSLKKAMRQGTKIVPLVNRETLEMKNIDPIATRKELIQDIAMELDIKVE
jgi:hypothetical protein